MVFNSLTFLVFLAILLPIYYRLERRRQNVLLLLASYLFYGWWDWRFLGLLILSSVVDYYLALAVENAPDQRRRRQMLIVSILMNMGVLGFFKYYNFFAESAVQVFGTLGWQADLPTLHVLLPLGISFYTFLSMSYVIDVYRREVEASRDPVEFLLYVAFFPHLVAGPIVRASYLLPQIKNVRTIRHEQVLDGIWLFLLGMVKKVVIADQLALIANWSFSADHYPWRDANAWIALYAFAFQIYGDFAGYSDMARGLSKLMGFELVVNFRAPYLVSNPSAFWQHWHISLSTWLRDYLYIPLGGNRLGRWFTYRNLVITMLLGGLWHGAGLAYLLWGAYQGALLCGQRLLCGDARRGDAQSRASSVWWWRVLAVAGFFHLTCLGWLLFRAGSLPGDGTQRAVIGRFLQTLFQFRLHEGITPLLLPVALLGGLALLLQWRHTEMERFSGWRGRWQAAGAFGAGLLILGFGNLQGSSFIYFQF